MNIASRIIILRQQHFILFSKNYILCEILTISHMLCIWSMAINDYVSIKFVVASLSYIKEYLTLKDKEQKSFIYYVIIYLIFDILKHIFDYPPCHMIFF